MDPFAHHLNLWVIGTLIILDRIALVINRFALPRDPFQVRTQFLVTHTCVDLRHGERTVAEQAADDWKQGRFH